MAYIYIIKNKINDFVYIGATKMKPESRFKQHKKPSTLLKRDYKIQKAFKELGVDNFYCELLEIVDEKEMYNKEVYYIKKYNSYHNGYNSTPGGKGGKLIVDKDEIKKIIKEYNKKHNITEIAIKYNVCEFTIKRLLEENNIEIKKKRKTKNGYVLGESVRAFDTKEKIDLLIKDYYDGLTYLELAKKYKVDQRTIGRYLKKLHIIRRGKGNTAKKIFIEKEEDDDANTTTQCRKETNQHY